MGWISIAFELGKSIFALITEAVGADSKKLEELATRFETLIRVGSEELAEARKASADAAAHTNERLAAALARIKAARLGTPVTP